MKKYGKCILQGSLWLLAALSFVVLGLGVYSNQVMKDLKDNIVRLHVVADSDIQEAQDLKLKVRDSVTAYTKDILQGSSDAKESYGILQAHIDEIQKVAEARARVEGCDLPVSATLGEFEFPVKSYGDISLPSGLYNAVKVTIGSGEGKNWWCVLFPPLCFVDSENAAVSASGRVQMEESLSSESYDVIQNEPEEGKIKIKFKIVDFFESIAQKARGSWTNLF